MCFRNCKSFVALELTHGGLEFGKMNSGQELREKQRERVCVWKLSAQELIEDRKHNKIRLDLTRSHVSPTTDASDELPVNQPSRVACFRYETLRLLIQSESVTSF